MGAWVRRPRLDARAPGFGRAPAFSGPRIGVTDAASPGVGAVVPAAQGQEAVGQVRARWLGRLLSNRNVVGGGAVFLLFLLAAIVAPVVTTHSPTRLNPVNRLKPPSAANYLGTDEFGRDVYS